ncbi:MAG: hypothetical protein FJ395_19640 [Verrucomicrobia bacterium]|nr:hypothetical protein [Verrucomicrobiota bacterium]
MPKTRSSVRFSPGINCVELSPDVFDANNELPGAKDWTVGVSLKFTGPACIKDSQEKENGFYLDRLVLVRPGALTESSEPFFQRTRWPETMRPTLTTTVKTTLTLLTALLLAPLVAHAQQAAPNTVRDRLWVFAPPADGPRLYYESAGYRGGSRMTPVEGAFWLGVPTLMFIVQT